MHGGECWTEHAKISEKAKIELTHHLRVAINGCKVAPFLLPFDVRVKILTSCTFTYLNMLFPAQILFL